MSLTCVKCSRANPDEAVYCYHDGFVLNGHAGRAGTGPVAIGAQQFANPFVFPSGRTCRSFDELAIACQENWGSAKELLSGGFFGSFFGGMGRADLARAADEAKKFGDLERGLDQLLDKLPTEVLQEPKLRVDPVEINLGTLEVGQDRQLELHLDNQGMRLLHGKVIAVNTPWLTLGEGQGVAEKLFQFTHENKISVNVKGAKLRANNKPLEGKLVVDSNGGEPVTVIVRCSVPVKPYPGSGPLAGARSPRQVAEKAKLKAKEAAVLFEKGQVAEWYKSNGWTYPVQGPTAVGLGAVQQFFEALGLTPPPKVDISHRSVSLSGAVGDQNLRHVLEVKTEEKRPVYAHGSSNQPWLEVSRAKLNGRVAQITLTVPQVPDRAGETLTAKVTVQSNGTQKFVVPVTLTIGDNLDFTSDAPAVIPVTVEAPRAKAVATMPVMTLEAAEPAAPMIVTPRRRGGGGPHWLAAAALAACLVVLILLDVLRGKPREEIEKPPQLTEGKGLVDLLQETSPKLRMGFTEDKRFGFSLIDAKDPKNPKEDKRLTFDPNGGTNNTVIRINNYEYVFGRKYQDATIYGLQEIVKDKYWTAKVIYRDHGVTVVQHVLLVPGSSGNLDNCLVYYSIQNTGGKQPTVGLRVLLDTYIGANDGVPFTIPGRKELMKTFIDLRGKNVPDFIEAVENEDPNDPGTVARFGLSLSGVRLPEVKMQKKDSRGKRVVDAKGKPVWEFEPYPPVDKFDEITRLVICQQPDNPQVKWNWGDGAEEFLPIATEIKKDSCVLMFWDEVRMNRNEIRTVGFTYGLNSLDITKGDDGGGRGLALSAPPGAVQDREFSVTATVYGARQGQTVTLELLDGLELAAGEKATKPVEIQKAGERVPVTWKVKATKLGEAKVKAKSGSTETKPRKIRIRADSIFG